MSDDEKNRNTILIFKKGCSIIIPIMNKNNFILYDGKKGQSSGGFFVSCLFKKFERELRFSYRESLGDVQYKMYDYSLDHVTYMKFLKVRSKYPDFVNDPLESFNQFAFDLENYCQDFLNGSGKDFMKYALAFRNNKNIFKGFNQLP